MSALWTPGRAGVSPGFLQQSPAPPSQVRPHRPRVACRIQHPPPGSHHTSPNQRHDLKHQTLAGTHAKAHRPWFDVGPARTEPDPPRSCPKSAYSTRVGIHWPRVVRTARGPHLRGVRTTLLQWNPSLVQCAQTTPAATTVTGSAPADKASNNSHASETRRTGVLRCQDIRDSQKS